MSYGASTPTLSDRRMFPRFFRTIPSEVQSNSARFALMDRFNWRRVATLHETRNIFSLVRCVGKHVHVCLYSYNVCMYIVYTCACVHVVIYIYMYNVHVCTVHCACCKYILSCVRYMYMYIRLTAHHSLS